MQMYMYTTVCHVHNVKLTDFLLLIGSYCLCAKICWDLHRHKSCLTNVLKQANLTFSCAHCINQRVREYTSVLCSLLFHQVTHELPFLLAYPGSPCAVLWDWSNLTWFPKGSVAYSLRRICCVSKTLLKWTVTAERALHELLLCKTGDLTHHIYVYFKVQFSRMFRFRLSCHKFIISRFQTPSVDNVIYNSWFYWSLLANP